LPWARRRANAAELSSVSWSGWLKVAGRNVLPGDGASGCGFGNGADGRGRLGCGQCAGAENVSGTVGGGYGAGAGGGKAESDAWVGRGSTGASGGRYVGGAGRANAGDAAWCGISGSCGGGAGGSVGGMETGTAA
jgi:hypothetical protein